MQDMTVHATPRSLPDFAPADARATVDPATCEFDEASFLQFEALMPMAQNDPGLGPAGLGDDAGVAAVSGASGVAAAGGPAAAPAGASAPATTESEAGGRPAAAHAAASDAIVSTYTIHHARLGTVHVQQSNGAHGAVGAFALRTDDDALRARLRDAVQALRGAVADGAGNGPHVSVDA